MGHWKSCRFSFFFNLQRIQAFFTIQNFHIFLHISFFFSHLFHILIYFHTQRFMHSHTRLWSLTTHMSGPSEYSQNNHQGNSCHSNSPVGSSLWPVTLGTTSRAYDLVLIVFCRARQGELTVQEGGPESLRGFITHGHPGVIELPVVRALEKVRSPCKRKNILGGRLCFCRLGKTGYCSSQISHLASTDLRTIPHWLYVCLPPFGCSTI